MLLSLDVRDFVIVDQLTLDFDPGLTVLTGETGAGKSLLIDALSMVLGARVDSTWVRRGKERAEVAATFALSPERVMSHEDAARASAGTLTEWLKEEGFDTEEGSLLIRRQVDTQGRSKAWINGRSATAQQLKTLAEAFIDIHGQHAHQSLLKPSHQRALLDAYGGHEALLNEVAGAWARWRAAEADLEALTREQQRLEEELLGLQREHEELKAHAMTPEEWQELQQEQARLAHAAHLIEGAQSIVSILSEGEAPVISALAEVVQTLRELADIDSTLEAPLDLLQGAEIALQEAQSDIGRYAHRIELDPERLSEVDQRIQSVLTTCRRYRLTPESMMDRLTELTLRLQRLEGALSEETLIKARDEAKADYSRHAETLSAMRRAAGARLDAAVTANIRRLALGDGTFIVDWVPIPEGSRWGNESVVFSWSQYPGQPPNPIAKTASGGELSRLSLALQTVLSSVSDVPTMIFDEVDTGIGGGVAEIVGQLLYDVAQASQVMCVTHLPQVAAWADHHFTVSKRLNAEGVPESRIDYLSEAERIEEIARMLGGVTLTETTRAHAKELLTLKRRASSS